MTRRHGVLVVDGDPAIRGFLGLALDLDDYEVRTAGNGREALRLLRAWWPSVILLDLMMPVLDGWGFRAEQLRDERLSGIPVVLLSTICELQHEARKLGVTACLRKPCDLDELLATVRRLVDRA
jgi:DNA-binding response OmpR family regulator